MNKPKIIIIVVLILCIILCLLLLDREEINEGNDNPIISNEITLSQVSDSNEFFSVRSVINDFFALTNGGSADEIYSLLGNEYIHENNITVSNVLDILNYNYFWPTYTATKMYLKTNTEIDYYFVEGYIIESTEDEDLIFYDNVYVLVLIKNDNYNIIPLEIDEDLEQFASNYYFDEDLEINGNNTYRNIRTSEENKLTTYIQTFKNMLAIDIDRAFNMLDSSSQEYFESVANFSLYRDDILDKLSVVIFSYSINENDDVIIYNITDNNLNRITIYEENIIDYRIDLKNVNFSV